MTQTNDTATAESTRTADAPATSLSEYTVRTIDVKDFIWAKNASGRWAIRNVPLGEGMVDFPAFFKLVKELGIAGPISVHYEYAPFESMATPANRAQHVKDAIVAMRRDLVRLREMLDRAEIETGNASA